MANPQEKSSTATSAVASCQATDCSHNHDGQCHAGEIQVEMGGQGPVCGTYEPRSTKPRP